MARQKLGQHFLFQETILERIAAAVCPERRDLVVEIGPGRGALTEKLLSRAERVVAIEVDPALAGFLRGRFAGERRLDILEADALETDLTRWGRAAIAGNLPYYIATPIIEKTVRAAPPRAVFLIQKEVARRLTARPGQRDYGFLTVQTAVFASARVLFDVKPGAFRPPPKVDSAVVALEPLSASPVTGDREAFLGFVSLCFRHKRKTLRNNLAGVYGGAVESWPEAGMRAEQIPLEGFVEMWGRMAHGR